MALTQLARQDWCCDKKNVRQVARSFFNRSWLQRKALHYATHCDLASVKATEAVARLAADNESELPDGHYAIEPFGYTRPVVDLPGPTLNMGDFYRSFS